MHEKSGLKVKCPRCSKPVNWQDSEVNKPFCSERCKMIDLGKWANEDHVIPGEEIDQLTVDKNNSE